MRTEKLRLRSGRYRSGWFDGGRQGSRLRALARQSEPLAILRKSRRLVRIVEDGASDAKI